MSDTKRLDVLNVRKLYEDGELVSWLTSEGMFNVSKLSDGIIRTIFLDKIDVCFVSDANDDIEEYLKEFRILSLCIAGISGDPKLNKNHSKAIKIYSEYVEEFVSSLIIGSNDKLDAYLEISDAIDDAYDNALEMYCNNHKISREWYKD